MKKIIAALIMFTALSSYAQIGNIQIMNDTTINGSVFKFKYAGMLQVTVVDSMLNDSTSKPGYISLINSRAKIWYIKTRIINGDTIIRQESVSIPLVDVGSKYSNLINSNEFKKALRKAVRKESFNRKLSEN